MYTLLVLYYVKQLHELHFKRSEDGTTPVHVAATWGRYQALNLLLHNGGNPDLCDEDGANAFDMAKEHDNTDCLNLIVTYQTEEIQAKRSQELDTFVTSKLHVHVISMCVTKVPLQVKPCSWTLSEEHNFIALLKIPIENFTSYSKSVFKKIGKKHGKNEQQVCNLFALIM